MKEYDLGFDSFIGGWYIPTEVCDNLIDLYNSEQDSWKDGECGRGGVTPEWKKCKELYIPPTDFDKKLKEYLDYLSKCLDLYKKRYSFCDDVGLYSLKDNNIKIQHYMPGDGFYKWHMENGGVGNSKFRHLVFMTYLNTLNNAGTEFYYQKTTTPCEKGLTIIWPSAWTHTHKGVINNDGEKYIITGWYSFHEDQ